MTTQVINIICMYFILGIIIDGVFTFLVYLFHDKLMVIHPELGEMTLGEHACIIVGWPAVIGYVAYCFISD